MDGSVGLLLLADVEEGREFVVADD